MTPNIKNQIAPKIGLSELEETGITILRDENSFRINEKDIEYFWILNFNHLTTEGDYGIFTIKFKESRFRGIKNQKEIIRGIFNLKKEKIDHLYFETDTLNFDDKIAEKFNGLDLFYTKDLDENEVPSIIELLIEFENISAKIDCQYIVNKNWVDWNNEIIKFSKNISEKSKNLDLQKVTDVLY
ncbi:MAG: hypothetical protein JKX84_05575 [Flavobacteriales bacterium]|nr:hypothetical protein [Flavobacteriales bacterium]